MRKIEITAFELAERFIGSKEIAGTASNPLILAMLQLDQSWPQKDEVPWCSAFINFVCWLLRLPRSKNLWARSWLTLGKIIPLEEAEAGFDIAILKRTMGVQPGPEVINAPGHVGFFAGKEEGVILLLGGNQDDSVNVRRFMRKDLLGIRRIFE